MITPMMIDEVNEHTTAAVNGIPTPPEPFSLTDLMIEGYEYQKVETRISTQSTITTLDVYGEGYLEGLLLQSDSTTQLPATMRVLIDGKIIYNVSYSTITAWKPCGFAVSDAVYAATNTISMFGLCLSTTGGYFSNIENKNILGKTDITAIDAGECFFFIKYPIHFKKRLQVVSSLGYKYGYLRGGYYLKTGGGN